jgi:hypothetical protein
MLPVDDGAVNAVREGSSLLGGVEHRVALSGVAY